MTPRCTVKRWLGCCVGVNVSVKLVPSRNVKLAVELPGMMVAHRSNHIVRTAMGRQSQGQTSSTGSSRVDKDELMLVRIQNLKLQNYNKQDYECDFTENMSSCPARHIR